jgi:hypothetical protein
MAELHGERAVGRGDRVIGRRLEHDPITLVVER